MMPQHLLLASAAALAADLVGAFSPPSTSVGPSGAPRAAGARSGRSPSGVGRLRAASLDEQALSELEDLISDLMEASGGGGEGRSDRLSVLPCLSPGRSAPSSASLSEASAAHGMPWSDTIGRTDEANPLLYMPFWEWQLDFMQSSLTNLHPIECRTLEGEDVSFKENAEKRARIVNHCYASDEYRKIRMTYYDAGDAVQVFNSVWYPDAKYNLPVLGIDLLSFNRKRYLAIVDYQPLHEDEEDHATTYEHILHPIKDKYDSLKGKMSARFYDETQFFSQEMLFARFDNDGVVTQDLFPAYQEYVKTHVDLLKGTEPATSREDVLRVFDRQRAYDTYSADRDPAAGLFAANFGKKWAEDFIYDFLFSLSERSEEGLSFAPPGPPGGRKPGGGPGGPPPSGGPPAARGGPPAKKEDAPKKAVSMV